jgi:2-amino-4-hydroxy-6-hydroxymethyldihydropteridine diphosphokinase
MQTAYIALGANLPSAAGSPRETLDAAIAQIASLGKVLRQSSYYETEPVGYADQPMFTNAVVAIQTKLSPLNLLQELLEIELKFGRNRTNAIPNGPRTLDLDILMYGDYVLGGDTLVVPHPRMLQRGFVMVPLAEIAPKEIHPQARKSMSQLGNEFGNPTRTNDA